MASLDLGRSILRPVNALTGIVCFLLLLPENPPMYSEQSCRAVLRDWGANTITTN